LYKYLLKFVFCVVDNTSNLRYQRAILK